VLPSTPRAARTLDLRAVLYNVAAFGLLLLAIGDAAHLAGAHRIVPELAVALLFFVLLVRREAGHPAPLLPVDLFRRPMFTLSALTSICTFATQGLAFVSLPFYFETVLGRSPVETGFLITPWAVLVGVMAPIAGRLTDRYSSGALGGIGLAALAAGMLSLVLLPAHASVLDICWRMALCGVGFGFFQTPNLKAIMGSAPPHRSGGASGVVATCRLIGQATGAALVAFCFTVSARSGTTYALALGASFAAVASVASFSRMFVGAGADAPAPAVVVK